MQARTVALEPGAVVDLLEVCGERGVLFERDGAGLAGHGCALSIDLPDGLCDPAGVAAIVATALAGIESDDEVGRPGCGPVAFGALPFERGVAGRLVVPATIVGRAADGTTWLTTVGPQTPEPPHGPRQLAPDAFTLTSVVPHEAWCKSVHDAIVAIQDGRVGKVVLAREVLVEANRPIIASEVLGRLRSLYPSCLVFSVDGFVGASPELLIQRFGAEVRSHPLAGTVARSGDPVADERLAARLLASGKDRREHTYVVDAVAGVLGTVCERLEVPANPSILNLRNVTHLATLIEGRLAGPAHDRPTALGLAAALHPTPAVGGTPTDIALEVISELEPMVRGHYAGPVGWVDARGDGQWAVGIRCAELQGHRARLVAGVGLVAGSVPELELAETQLKLQALLAAVVRP